MAASCPTVAAALTAVAAGGRNDAVSSGCLRLYSAAEGRSRRSRFITLCSDPSSDSSPCSTSGRNAPTRFIKRGEIGTGWASSSVEEEASAENPAGNEGGDGGGSISGVKKRPLWRKIRFRSRKLRSVLLLNVVAVVYASDICMVKAVEATTDPAAFAAVRFLVSAIPFVPFLLRSRGDSHTRNAGFELGLWASLGYLIEAVGLLTADASRASFISLFTVIAVPLLDGMLGGIVPARTWFGVLMSAIGVAMLESSGSPPNVGDLLSFLSALFFGIHMLRTEHFSRKMKKEDFLPLLGYEVCVVAMSSTIWVVIGGLLDGNRELSQSSWSWLMMWDWVVSFPWMPALYTGVFSTGLCLWAEMAAMRSVSATETAVIYGLEPLWGAGFAWFLLGERWGTAGWIGAALVLGGSLVVQILGNVSESIKSESKEKKVGLVLVPEKQRNLSVTPILVRSKKE
ncbi:unnamed protein product [Linum tenue]|uniref:EamA domain-containing protein n=1 Tax=Linum tenue TaxID=586396 RepID=A0AAV0I977_9ROSI|nr:unnamed protein product [Linum tenue]